MHACAWTPPHNCDYNRFPLELHHMVSFKVFNALLSVPPVQCVFTVFAWLLPASGCPANLLLVIVLQQAACS
jgi:hypothetical protein